jgi:hypothetical protein
MERNKTRRIKGVQFFVVVQGGHVVEDVVAGDVVGSDSR